MSELIAVMKCGDCGTELRRSNPFPPKDRPFVLLSSALMNERCPNGCRATYSDCNMNTAFDFIDAKTGELIEAAS
jgi:hypothetical protein